MKEFINGLLRPQIIVQKEEKRQEIAASRAEIARKIGVIERIDPERGGVFEWPLRNVSLPNPWEKAFPVLRSSLPDFFREVSVEPNMQTTGWWRDDQLDATLLFGTEGFIRVQYSKAREGIEEGRHNGVVAVITRGADACTFEYEYINDELTRLAVADECLQVIQNAFQRQK